MSRSQPRSTKSTHSFIRTISPTLSLMVVAAACGSPNLETEYAPNEGFTSAPPPAVLAAGDEAAGWSSLGDNGFHLTLDEERGSVASLTGGGEFDLNKARRVAAPDSITFNLSWEMRFQSDWTLDVDVVTTKGPRTLRYLPVDSDALSVNGRIEHGVGSWINDNQWHTISRDLNVDLKAAEPTASILSVIRLQVRGSGLIDAIQLMTPSKDEGSVASALTGLQPLLAMGARHSCESIDGGVRCWGANDGGQIGNNSLTTAPFPVAISGLQSNVTSISAKGDRSCAVVNGSAKCWGTGIKTPGQVSGLTTGVTAITTGPTHSCALVSGGVKCWTTAAPTPVSVSGLTSGVTAISAGINFTCALTSAGAVKCWGTTNAYGQLGNNSLTASSTPVAVYGLSSGVLAISAGDTHACARTSTNVKCWGRNATGQLGNNSTATYSKVPVTVSNLGATKFISAGGGHTCAIDSAGSVKCWGANNYGQLGNNTTSTTPSRVPVQVYTLTGSGFAVSAGANHSCARINNATRCWGYNVKGQLGNGFYVNSSRQVETASPFSAVGEIKKPGSYVVTTNLTTGTAPAIYVHDTTDVTLNCNGRTLATNNFALNVLSVYNVTRLTLLNCVIQNTFATSLRIEKVNSATVQKNTVTAVEIVSSNLVRFTQNLVNGNSNNGYVMVRYSTNSLIDANTVNGPTTGLVAGLVYAHNGSKNRVINNKLDGRWSGAESDFNVKGSDDGVIMSDEDLCEVSGNTITNNWDASIESVGSLTNCTIANNKLSNNLITAIGGWYWNSWRANKVTGNTANNTGKLFLIRREYGFRNTAEIMYFRDNVFTGNTETGNIDNPTFINMDWTYARGQDNGIAITADKVSVGNNHFGGNTFGGPTPILWPVAAMVDDGANVCAKGTDATMPLACGRP